MLVLEVLDETALFLYSLLWIVDFGGFKYKVYENPLVINSGEVYGLDTLYVAG